MKIKAVEESDCVVVWSCPAVWWVGGQTDQLLPLVT